jgi:hypothetical protein
MQLWRQRADSWLQTDPQVDTITANMQAHAACGTPQAPKNLAA